MNISALVGGVFLFYDYIGMISVLMMMSWIFPVLFMSLGICRYSSDTPLHPFSLDLSDIKLRSWGALRSLMALLTQEFSRDRREYIVSWRLDNQVFRGLAPSDHSWSKVIIGVVILVGMLMILFVWRVRSRQVYV